MPEGSIFMQSVLKRIEGKEIKIFSMVSLLLLLVASCLTGTIQEAVQGMWQIVISRDALITDYFELVGYGPALFNGVLVLGTTIVLVLVQKIPFTGLTVAALSINAGYALWGKNPVNILPIFLGTALYAHVHKARLGRYLYTALFGTCLAPILTELVYLLPFGRPWNQVIAIAAGLFMGFVLPPLSVHAASMHMGYSLFNVGFSGGILAFVVVSILRSFGMESHAVLIWKEGTNSTMAVVLYSYFVVTILYGWLISKGDLKGLIGLMQRPGRAVTDFVMMDGAGPALMNMGLVGITTTTYILLVGGDFSGPIVGAIWTAFGFAAFGVHIKNYLPVLAGVYLSTLVSVYTPTTPGIQLAAVFAAGLAPIAGQFGPLAGIAAGFLHAGIVMCTAQMYGGLNLYNNGFSAGWVAIFMVPVIESGMKRFKIKKGKK